MDIDLDRNPEPQATLWSCCGEIDMDLCPWTKRDNGNVHRAAAEIIVSKNHGAGGSVCNVLLSWHICHVFNVGTRVYALRACR